MVEQAQTGRDAGCLDTRKLLMGSLKLLTAILLCVVAYLFVFYRTADYEKVLGEPARPTHTIEGHRIPKSVKDFEKALEGMKATNDLVTNWAIILLGGTIGIAILAKGAKIRDQNWGLVFIPPTWVLLLSSLLNGSHFKGKLTYQLAHGQYVFRELNLYLFLQKYFFEWSIVALIVLAGWYLLFRFALLEERATGGE